MLLTCDSVQLCLLQLIFSINYRWSLNWAISAELRFESCYILPRIIFQRKNVVQAHLIIPQVILPRQGVFFPLSNRFSRNDREEERKKRVRC